MTARHRNTFANWGL